MGKSKKKQKLKHVVPVLIGNLQKSLGKPKYEPIRVLLDSGTTGTIILHKYVQKLRTRQSQKPTLWKTKGGNFTTAQECKILFQLPELDRSKVIEWNVHVDTTVSPYVSKYDMIMGTDLLKALGIGLDFSTCMVTWDNATVPMRDGDLLSTRMQLNYLFKESYESDIVQDATARMTRILDAKYEKVNLHSVVQRC